MAISPEESVYIDRRKNCTKDEVVARLIGWTQGPIRRRFDDVEFDDDHGTHILTFPPEHQLETRYSQEECLEFVLIGTLGLARDAFVEAVEGNASLAEIHEKKAAIRVARKRVEDADAYFRDIESELAKGKGSVLKVDPTAKGAAWDPPLTLESVKLWARKKYGIALIDREFTAGPQVQPRVTTESLSQWTNDKFGIGAPEWEPWNQNPVSDGVRWQDVTIKIYADDQIGCLWGNGKVKRMSFIDVGLKGKRKSQPNQLGLILIGLSLREKFPPQTIAKAKDTTAVSKLRAALIRLAGISDDPFYRISEVDGWKPRFKLIDDRRNADERAKAKAQHEGYDEARYAPQVPDYGGMDDEQKGDDAAKWLEEND